MTDTDKLKRLAEAMVNNCPRGIKMDRELTEATGILILALIAENERLKEEKRNMQGVFNDTVGECDKLSTERDEAVALLRKAQLYVSLASYKDSDMAYNRARDENGEITNFLARIDAWE